MSSHRIINLILTRISVKPLGAEVHGDINILKLGYSPEAGTLKFSGEKIMSYFSHISVVLIELLASS